MLQSMRTCIPGFRALAWRHCSAGSAVAAWRQPPRTAYSLPARLQRASERAGGALHPALAMSSAPRPSDPRPKAGPPRAPTGTSLRAASKRNGRKAPPAHGWSAVGRRSFIAARSGSGPGDARRTTHADGRDQSPRRTQGQPGLPWLPARTDPRTIQIWHLERPRCNE